MPSNLEKKYFLLTSSTVFSKFSVLITVVAKLSFPLLSVAFRSIQHFLSMIKDFHLLKFEISSKNIQCFKTNILTLITPESERRVRTGVGSGEGIWFLNAVHFLELSFYRQKSAESFTILGIANKNLTSWSINNAKIHWHSSCCSQNI